MSDALGAVPVVCHGHQDLPTNTFCGGCGRPTCDTCAFRSGASRYCFDCMSAGATGGGGKSALLYSAVSIGFGMLAAICTSVALFHGASPEYAGALGAGMMIFPLAGLATGFIGRDYSRRTGSPLALIGVIANSALFAVFFVMWIIGITSK
jgi:hypothetical protein